MTDNVCAASRTSQLLYSKEEQAHCHLGQTGKSNSWILSFRSPLMISPAFSVLQRNQKTLKSPWRSWLECTVYLPVLSTRTQVALFECDFGSRTLCFVHVPVHSKPGVLVRVYEFNFRHHAETTHITVLSSQAFLCVPWTSVKQDAFGSLPALA